MKISRAGYAPALKPDFCDNPFMRLVLWLLIPSTALAQSGPQVQLSHTTESLRGVSAVSRQVAWASGTHGTYLRTVDSGKTWTPAQVPEASTLDFRAVVALSADEAFLMSAGPGDQSRIYHTSDAGRHWQLQFTNSNPKGFFDSMAFWDSRHGVVLGDPIPDEKGQLHFEAVMTDDGETWNPISSAQLPLALEGEGAFAASNTCIAILRSPTVTRSGAVAQEQPQRLRSRRPARVEGISTLATPFGAHLKMIPTADNPRIAPLLQEAAQKSGALALRQPAEKQGAPAPVAPDPNIWFGTGGKTARVFHSADRGKTWEVFDTPILHGPDSAGIFSIAFRDPQHGVIAGGDYKHPGDDGPNLAFTEEGGKTWRLSSLHPQAFFSAVAYDQQVNAAAIRQQNEAPVKKGIGKKFPLNPVAPQRLFIIGQDFIFDFHPPSNPHRINGKKKEGYLFNAVSAFPEGGALVVGPKGTIAFIP